MSVITETATTVIDADMLFSKSTSANKFENQQVIVSPFTVIEGYISPRTNGYYPLRDNDTNDPILLPDNVLPMHVCFIPSVPLASAALGTSTVRFLFGNDSNFTMVYQPWNDSQMPPLNYGVFTGTEVNSKTFLRLAEYYSKVADYDTYRHIGVETTNDVFTNGTVQVYLFCHTF